MQDHKTEKEITARPEPAQPLRYQYAGLAKALYWRESDKLPTFAHNTSVTAIRFGDIFC